MRIARVKFAFGADDTVVTEKLPIEANGFALTYKINIPQCSGTPTATLSIYDLDEDLIYSKASLAENTVTVVHARAESKDIPLMPGANISLTFTGAPVSVTPKVTFYIE